MYESGKLKDQEKIVAMVGEYVLTETVKREKVHYRVINTWNMHPKYLAVRDCSLRPEDYRKLVEEKAVPANLYGGVSPEELLSTEQRSEILLNHIFEKVLPAQGMHLRKDQRDMSLIILHALQRGEIALCEAGVGTGKTHAYIMALIVYGLFSDKKRTSVISTSTIALQKAMTEEYIPQISSILLRHGIIEETLSFVVRKGKSHYVCEYRRRQFEKLLLQESYNEGEKGMDRELLLKIQKLGNQGKDLYDLDDIDTEMHVKDRICVISCADDCIYAGNCKYMDFRKKCAREEFDLQITNHNYMLADIIHTSSGGRSLFPDYGVVVFDEAHKLMDAAKQMYTISFCYDEILLLKRYLEIDVHGTDGALFFLYDRIEECCRELFGELCSEFDSKKEGRVERKSTQIDMQVRRLMKKMESDLEQIPFYCGEKELSRYRSIKSLCRELAGKLYMLQNKEENISWAERDERGNYVLCAHPVNLGLLLYRDIWSREIPMVLTSGTMSVNGDMTHFKSRLGCQYVHLTRICEFSKKSPFVYERQGILYIPEEMPFPNIKDSEYLNAVREEIENIVRASCGHTMILFTSYSMMERIYGKLKDSLFEYPLYMMGKGRLDVISRFRNSGNGVLLASDSAGEGIDLAGDILSSLIIVKLPFPVPDPVMEFQRGRFHCLEEYKMDVIIPQMLIKLRQWIGRGIRNEEDTVVFCILDSRVVDKGRYRDIVLANLPRMPLTNSLEDIERFMECNKEQEYFMGQY